MALAFFCEMPVKSCMFYLFTLFFSPCDFLFSSLMSGYLCQPQGRESYDLQNKDGSFKFHLNGSGRSVGSALLQNMHSKLQLCSFLHVVLLLPFFLKIEVDSMQWYILPAHVLKLRLLIAVVSVIQQFSFSLFHLGA